MKNLSHLAFKSQDSLGRALPAAFDRDRNLYSMDRFLLDLVKIQYSKALRRLRGKTQVLSGLGNVYIRDRMIHSFEVSAASMQTGARLALNIPLLQVGSISHDLGHVAMGHLGEKFITKKIGENFRHERFAIFVLEMVERNGEGLNLSYETLNAILNHSRGSGLMTTKNGLLEDDVIMFCDKLSYIFSDFNDISRIDYNDFMPPPEMLKLGRNQSERLNNCLQAMWKESIREEKISFEHSEQAQYFKIVRDFMYKEVYFKIDEGEVRSQLKEILSRVYDYFANYFDDKRQAALALALMSEQDVYALYYLLGSYDSQVIDEKIRDTSTFAIAELLPRIPGLAEFDFCNPDRFMDKKNFGKVSKLECFAR
jgi:dGTP triphosphohydrolase